jgi:hypothetical protein
MGAAVYHHTPYVGLADLLLDHTGRPAAPTIRHGRPDAAALELHISMPRQVCTSNTSLAEDGSG